VFCADVVDGLVNHLLKLAWGNVSESCAGFADSLMKDTPANSLLNEFRKVTLLHALGTQEGAQGMIGLFGPGNGQTGGFWFDAGCFSHISVYPPISLGDEMVLNKGARGGGLLVLNAICDHL
jgi:hypothetical protein